MGQSSYRTQQQWLAWIGPEKGHPFLWIWFLWEGLFYAFCFSLSYSCNLFFCVCSCCGWIPSLVVPFLFGNRALLICYNGNRLELDDAQILVEKLGVVI